MSDAKLVMMDAAGLRDAVHSRQVSCVEVMDAYLDHIMHGACTRWHAPALLAS